MSRTLKSFLLSVSPEFHLVIALIWGLFFRVASAWYVYGAQALDDYRHGLLPAYQSWAGLESTLPDYRSPLLTWCLKFLLDVGEFFSITHPVEQARWIYLWLGVFSLLGIYGAYLLTHRRYPTNQLLTPLAVYAVSLHGIMPFVSTRAFGESIATTLVLLGFGLLLKERDRRGAGFTPYLSGFLVLGLAVLFRFQVGLIYVGYVGALFFLQQRHKLTAAFVVGIGLIFLQSGIDLLADRGPMETLWAYFEANKDGAASYGTNPWYNPILLLLALTFFPLSFPVFRDFSNFIRSNFETLVPFLLFVFVHCLIPHKEERFMYPVFGLVLIYLAFFLAENWERRWVRRLYLPALFVLNASILVVASFNNTQASEIEPIEAIEHRYKAVLILDLESILGKSWVREYYIRPPHKLISVQSEDLEDNLHQITYGYDAFLLISSNAEHHDRLRSFSPEGFSCSELLTATSFSDKMVYKLNPKRNQRRRPSWYRICSPKE